VPVRRLDHVVEELNLGPRGVFLKMDTQGWDLEVIRGAEACLPRIAALQSEMSVVPIYEGMPSYLDMLRELHGRGFEPAAMFPVSRQADLRLIEFDCVLVRP
jgi:hypothetical protein